MNNPSDGQVPQGRCGAKTRQGTPCARLPSPGSARCRFHGGKSLRGMAHPNFKDGRYSKHLPTRLSEAYEKARADPELLSLRDEAAILQARIADILGRVDTGESRRFWAKAAEGMDAFDAASAAGDTAGMRAALDALRGAIKGGARDWQSWEELQRTIESYRRVSESERRRLVDMQAMISAEEAMTFAGALTSLVRQHVADQDALTAIQEGMRQVFESRHVRTG